MSWRSLTGAELRRRVDHALVRLVVTDDSPAVLSDAGGWAALHPWHAEWEATGGTVDAPGDEAAALTALLDSAPPAQVDGLGWFGTARGGSLPFPAPWRIADGEGGDWDLMSATSVTAPDRDVQLVELDDTADADEIRAFNAAHNPHSEGRPGEGVTRLWLGVRDPDGPLAAVGAWQQLASGTPYLAGLVVDAGRRGQGLGGALLAELSRRALAQAPEVTLGVDAANARAIALYERMGFTRAMALTSVGLRRG